MAAEPADGVHVVEIPSPSDPLYPSPAAAATEEHHPLAEIAASPGHLLLLKLWQREEDRAAARAAARESLLDALRREASRLCALFFAFHAFALTLLFAASVRRGRPAACSAWWLPSVLSLLTSLVLAAAVHAKVRAYWRASARLQRERGDARALARCVQELRLKGAAFDLSKEPQAAKRMKSSSVEVRWQRRPIQWCTRYLITICLLCFTALVFPFCKFILCG